MGIPDNIRPEHILKAIEEANKNGIPQKRSSKDYFLEYNNKRYPPKYIVSLANKYANKEELDEGEFNGGNETNKFFIDRKFRITNKEGIEMTIIDKKLNSIQRYDILIKDYLSRKFPNTIISLIKRSWLKLEESNTLLYINGSAVYKDGSGWYDLDQSVYDKVVENSGFCLFMLGKVDITFVLPSEFIRSTFDDRLKITDNKDKKGKSNDLRWLFHIVEKNNQHYLQFNKKEEVNISDYLNRWNIINEFSSPQSNKINYFLIQVGRKGSNSILQNSYYDNPHWDQDKRDIDHGKVRQGDILVLYFAGESIRYKYAIKKIYRVVSVVDNNKRFNLLELITLKGIPYDRIVELQKDTDYKFFNKIGLQGYNIRQITEQDYDTILAIDEETNKNISIWIERLTTAFNEFGHISKYYHLNEIYSKIKEIIQRNNQEIPKNYEAITRFYLESNSRGKGEDLFEPKEIGTGYWRLKTKDSYDKNDAAKEEFSDIKNPSLWLIRAGGKGEGAQIALDNKLVGIGYGGLPELHKIKDFKTFKEHYERTHLEDTKYRVVSVIPQIWKFMNKLKIGDFVILPLPPQTKLMAIGKIMDEYKIGDLHSEIQQYRPVYWLKKDVSIEEFDPEIKRWLGARGTVHYVGGMEIVNKLTDMLKRLGVTDAELEKINHMDNTPTPDEDNKNDYNLENKWLSLKVVDIKEIIQNVLTAKNKKLEIDEKVVERIISHLAVSKHVILVGPPGTGKTDLARRVLRELGSMIINNPSPEEAVASYEWGRYEVIGGRSITSNEGKSSFHFGCVTSAIHKKRFLLIDEFNRADMNKAFGEMFLALDHGEIQLREDEYIDDIGNNTKIQIPENFRMICTMNDYDKSLLNELSYGLLRRFAFVEINVPDDKQKVKNIVVERTYKKLKHLDPKFDNEKVQLCIDKFIDFLFSIKSKREIGLASYIDVISYLMHSITVMKNDPGSALNDALVDYILPQFDRLDIETIRLAYDTASRIFIFQEENGKTIESINPFLFNLKNRIQRLEDLDKLFKFGEAG